MPRRDNDIISHSTLAFDRVHAFQVPVVAASTAIDLDVPPFRS